MTHLCAVLKIGRAIMRAFTFAVVSATTLAVCGSAAAQTAGLALTEPAYDEVANGIHINTRGAVSARSGAVSKLAKKAQERGLVRVMVRLDLNLDDDSDEESPQGRAQAVSLRSMQNSVAARVLGKATDPDASVTQFDYVPFIAMNVTAEQLQRLASDPAVLAIHEDMTAAPTLNQSVPFIRADDLWAQGFPGTGQAVAILDTGVDKNNAMFAGGKVVSEACYSTNNGSTIKSVCPGGVTQSTANNSGLNCPTNVEGCNHGTHVAGIAAGSKSTLKGVARASKIIAVQVFTRFNSQADCGSTPAPCVRTFGSDQLKGLERVFALRSQFKIASVNMSLGGGQFSRVCDDANASNEALAAIIKKLRGAKIATAIASGNNGFTGSISSPACLSPAIAVGSTGRTSNTVSNFSNHSQLVRLMAPGENIVSSVPGANATAALSGTSMATPHVAGAFALLRDVVQNATVDDVAAALECTGKPANVVDIVEPRIDLIAAKNYLLNPPKNTKTFNFNAASQANQWKPLNTTWSVAGGAYKPTPKAGFVGSSTANCNEAVTITAKLTRKGAATGGLGLLMFKTQITPVSGGQVLSGYTAVFQTGNPGLVALMRMDQSFFGNEDLSIAAILCQKSQNVGTGAHTLKVVSKGGKHTLTMDGTKICSATDTSYGTGRVIAATSFPSNTSGHTFTVDNVVIDPTDVKPPAPTSADEIASVE